MIYSGILKDTLKSESKPINRMYLNELTLNWKKVQSILDNDESEKVLQNYVAQMNIYLNLLASPKYSSVDSKTGFEPKHPIFQPYYIRDLLNLILKPTGILNNPLFTVKEQSFDSGLRFSPGDFLETVLKPHFEVKTSEKVYSVCLDMDLQYRPSGKKIFSKMKMNIPVMVFYLVKNLTKNDLYHIETIRTDICNANPNAYFAVICETVEDKMNENLLDLAPWTYVLRKNIQSAPVKEICIKVVLALKEAIISYTRSKKMTADSFIANGCLFPYEEKQKEINELPSEDE